MKRFLATLSVVLCLLAPATALAAYNPLGAACGRNTSSSACTANGSDPVTGAHGVLKKVSSIIAVIAGIAAVIMIIVGGLQYIMSAGDPQKITGARNMIIGSVVGLVIIVAAQSILLFVISKA